MPDTTFRPTDSRPATCGHGRRDEVSRWIEPTTRPGHYLGICRECERQRAANRRRNGARNPRIVAGQALGLRRRFGVEIECNITGGTHGSIATAIRTALPTGWKLKGDGSLGTNGAEIVSPPLRGDDGLAQLRTVLELLVARGATINRRCGLHVHHEVQDIGRDGLIHFVRSWTANQDLIDWLVSPSRREAAAPYYCRRWSENELRRLYSSSRYKTVNVQAFAKFGTVEVRQHQGTLSYRKIEAWIKLSQAMLDTVAGRGRSFGASGSLRELFSALGSRLDEDTAAFLLGRALQFGAPANRVIEYATVGTAVTE